MADFCLWCDHCGCEAIESPDGLFFDGDGSACMTCGWPGMVSADGDSEDGHAYWNMSDGDNGERCNRADCDECRSLGIDERKA